MLRIYNHYISRYAILLVGIESFLLAAVFYLSMSTRFYDQDIALVPLPSLFPEVIAYVFIIISSMAVIGMYQIDSRQDFKAILFRLMPSMVLSFALMTFVFYLIPVLYLGRDVLLMVMILSFCTIFVERTLFFKWSSLGVLHPRALVLGVGESAKELINQQEDDFGYRRPRIVGFVPFDGEERCVPESEVLASDDTLISLVEQYNVSEIIIATQERRGGRFPIQELLKCKMHGIKVTDIATFFEREKGHIRMDSLYPSWLVFGGGFDQSLFRSVIKRVFDVFACAILLVVAIPIMIITAILILIEDGYPIFYQQERVGKGGDTFMVLKFRSMKKNAEKDQAPQWSTENDPRITRIGKFIRKLRIDELPQILNVLKNEMSFVGPRPERPYFVDSLCAKVPYYNFRHTIKPGITGWAQVRYPYGSSVEDAIEKLQYDLYYVKNHSLFLDVIILIDTVEVVLFGKGGR